MQNVTIEERVSLLEIQVVDLDEDVDFLFDEQIIQDERLLNLKQKLEKLTSSLSSLVMKLTSLTISWKVSIDQ